MDKKLKKTIKKESKKFQWICILAITIIISIYVFGMTKYYIPSPIHIGAGQYLDIATGIIIVALMLTTFIIAMIRKKFRNDKK
ncbi:hypothetical protein LCGC14_0540120 [marine sediment metagenome]|uniref:Uncharacterized protein n=1 Tax=marine sediment metagenome TaxID=412755 RepID=A0A0F9RT38_9ZZZZ